MSVAEPESHARLLLDRIRGLTLKPSAEWAKIEAERPTVLSLYLTYIAPLAAIPVIAGVIGALAFGVSGLVSVNPVKVLIYGIVDYAVIFLPIVYLMTLVIDVLAETFGGKRDRLQALKVAAYSWTSVWIVGIVGVFPPLWPLYLLGLYSLFQLYRGLPILMKAPPEQAMGYSAAAVVSGLVIAFGLVLVRMALTGGA